MTQDVFALVERQFKEHFRELDDRKFHFASRLFLWAKDEFAKEKLKELRKEHIGSNEKEYTQKIQAILKNEKYSKKMLFSKIREPFFLKYPLLKKYNKILFLNLFCKTVYGIKLENIIEKYVPTEKFLEMKKLLESDKEAIAALSTHAANYFYILDFYLGGRGEIFSPEFLLNIARDEKLFNNVPSLRLYFLTHCIIGETAFYSRGIKERKKIYLQMLALAEKIIVDQYENVSLDNKFEFLVCTKLCGAKTPLLKRISNEAGACFNMKKKCFVEAKNINNDKTTLASAEHRNVLALMALYSKMDFKKL